MFTNKTTENERLEIKRKLYTGKTPWLIDKGHVSYDKNGDTYVESLETVHDETKHYICTQCGYKREVHWNGVNKYN